MFILMNNFTLIKTQDLVVVLELQWYLFLHFLVGVSSSKHKMKKQSFTNNSNEIFINELLRSSINLS